ncbi:MAG: N-acetylneuraminate synthase family protein [Candidatus Cloacimonetes bacterium]|nr:N-acetylneuraminate synthase family protein [Candidatus Cloacimonadota bacterium]
MSVFITGEIGINHNGDLEITKKLIDVAALAGCDAVKFQKRTVEDVYSKEDLERPRESPWGTTNREQKLGLEFGEKEYDEINSYCKSKGIEWFASAWDIKSLLFLRKYNLKYHKIASPMLTVKPLLEAIAEEKRNTFISTGMSTMDEISQAVEIFVKANCPFELMHCVSTYPMRNEDANLKMIETLKKRFNCKVGYSGHEVGLQISLAAVGMGATSIERHITLDRTMYGSDQAASVEPTGLIKLVRDIRIIEKALGMGEKVILDKEVSIKNKLRPVNWR